MTTQNSKTMEKKGSVIDNNNARFSLKKSGVTRSDNAHNGDQFTRYLQLITASVDQKVKWASDPKIELDAARILRFDANLSVRTAIINNPVIPLFFHHRNPQSVADILSELVRTVNHYMLFSGVQITFKAELMEEIKGDAETQIAIVELDESVVITTAGLAHEKLALSEPITFDVWQIETERETHSSVLISETNDLNSAVSAAIAALI